MIKSLVINCSLDPTAKILELLDALKEFSECNVVEFRDVSANFKISNDIDAVVISGSAAHITEPGDRNKFIEIMNLIKYLDRPLFSICYGHQLLCWSLGAKVAPHPSRIKRFEKIRIVNYNEIFEGFEKSLTVPLAQHHDDYVIKSSLQKARLILLADSKSCEVEAIKHQRKPFYGVQFHPERTNINNETHLEGLRIIENFFKNVVKR